MITEIFCVGTEILLGDIINTNAYHLTLLCAQNGLDVYRHTAVGDNPDRLREALENALKRSDCVLITGGLGPTNDDITRNIVAETLGLPLVYDKTLENQLLEYFRCHYPQMKISPNNFQQAYKPQGAITLKNTNGTACGYFIHRDEKIIVMLPGPPGEMLPMFKQEALPLLKPFCSHPLFTRTAKIVGLGESAVDGMIRDLLEEQTDPTIAPYAKPGEVHLRITTRAEDQSEALRKTAPLESELKYRFGDAVFTFDSDTVLETVIYGLLSDRAYHIATAESCTGGKIVARLINVPGMSHCLNESFVTYSNEAKTRHLGVREETLKAYGAVSKQTAEEMVNGLCERTGAEVGIVSTGIAGPDGGSKDKPVGLVYLGIRVGQETVVRKCLLKGDREEVRNRATQLALVEVYRMLVHDFEDELTCDTDA